MVGRYAMRRATSISPMVASENITSVVSTPSTGAKPRVSRAEPLSRKASYHDETPSAQ